MPTAKIKLLTSDKADGIRGAIALYVATIPASEVISIAPISSYLEKDLDTRFVTAVAHHLPGAVDEEGQSIIVERDKIDESQVELDAALAAVRHVTVDGDTTVAGTVTTSEPIFEAEDVGRGIESDDETRTIATFVSANEVTYGGDPLPSSASVDVSLLGAESVRSLSIDTRLQHDQDLRLTLLAVPGGALSASGALGGGGPNVIQVSNDYTVQSDIDFIAVDASAGPVTITLPPAGDGERKVHVKKIDASAFKVTVAPDGSDTVDGFTGFDILFQNNSYIFVSNEVDTWWVT
jgi:hypothetical protein